MKQLRLLALVCAASLPVLVCSQVEKMPWKEVVYTTDGFALTAPYPPLPQLDADIMDTTVYTVHVPNAKDAGLTLRVLHRARDCSAALGRLKDKLNGKTPGVDASSVRAPGVDAASVKDVSIERHPGLEYQWKVNSSTLGLERHYCVKDRLYMFSATWPSVNPLPATVKRIMNSFRLVKPEAHR